MVQILNLNRYIFGTVFVKSCVLILIRIQAGNTGEGDANPNEEEEQWFPMDLEFVSKVQNNRES